MRIGYNHFQTDGTEWYSCTFSVSPVGVSIEDANAVEHTFYSGCTTAGISAVEEGDGGHFNLFACHNAGAEVEFGNTLVLGEADDGVIIDWCLIREQSRADCHQVEPSLSRMQDVFPDRVKGIVTDRGK